MPKLRIVFLILFCLSVHKMAFTQNESQYFVTNDTDFSARNSNPDETTRLWLAGTGHGAAWSGTLLLLNQLWYKDYPRTSFHFHNDAPDWLQMDKIGHTATAYHLSRLSYQTFKWAGLNNTRAALWGSVSGSIMLTSIEILDGFSAQWGASISDFAANTIGSIGFLAQQLAWQDQRIVVKYSFSRSGLEQYRPDLLGKSLPENLLKDYNGQTYWLSANIHSFSGTTLPLPSWINIAFGYGAMGMMGSRENPVVHNLQNLPQMARYRQFYLSPDIDFTKIPTRSRTLHIFLQTLNFIKFPAPALEYNSHKGFKFHWLFF